MADVFSDFLHVRCASNYKPTTWSGRHLSEKQAAIDGVLLRLHELELTGATLEFDRIERLQACLALIGCSSQQVILGHDIFNEFQAWLAAGGRDAA